MNVGRGAVRVGSHAVVEHTADVGLRAVADDPAGLLAEASAALAEIAATVAGSPATVAVAVEARGTDPAALVFDWLNALIGVADERGDALVGADVDAAGLVDEWWIARGRARLAPYGRSVLPRLHVKAATFHDLRVGKEGRRWRLQAYLDV